MRIVIAERDQIGRRLLAQLLRMEGHDVLLIEEGGNARGLMKQHRPDVVLMNMFTAPQGGGLGSGKLDMSEADLISPVVMVTSMGTCENLSSFIGMGESVEAAGFDRLPANAKIGAMDHVQRVCEVLSRGMRSSEKNGRGSSAIQNSCQCLLDLCV